MLFNKVSIIGLGLIGGSLAVSLKNSAKVGEVIGIDNDKSTIGYALEQDIIDKGNAIISEDVYDSDVVVLATHIDSITQIAKTLRVSEHTVVTDVGSVKKTIVEQINSHNTFSFIGSHPIAGTEKSGVYNADPHIFKDAYCIITPTEKSAEKTIGQITKFWNIVGCKIIRMDPAMHDRIFAYVSHLPHAVAYSLINCFDANENYLDYAGGGLKDFTRIAESSPKMWAEILVSNRHEVLQSLEEFSKSIDIIYSLISRGEKKQLEEHLKYIVGLKSGV